MRERCTNNSIAADNEKTDIHNMKKNFALRVDEEVFAALERWAADEFRSVNGQIEWILAESLKKHKRYPKKNGVTLGKEGNNAQMQ